MTKLCDCIGALLEEIRISRQDFKKMIEKEGDAENWELEVSLPLRFELRSVGGEVTQDREGDVGFIFNSVLETLEIEGRSLDEQLVRSRLRNEIVLLFPRWQKGEMNKERLLNDFCQRVLVIFGDHLLFPAQATITKFDDAENASLRFEQLTENLARRLKGLFQVISEAKTEVWVEDIGPTDVEDGKIHSGWLKMKYWS